MSAPANEGSGDTASDLRTLQAWFQRAITTGGHDPASGATPTPIDQVILPSSDLSARERLAIYARMYTLRLEETLSLDFPAVRTHLGDSAFEDAARRYVTERPSRHFSLNHLGHDFADWLSSTTGPTRFHAVAVELAKLERSVTETFHAPADPPIDPSALQSTPPDRFLDVRFEPVRAMKLWRFEHEVNAYVSAVKALNTTGEKDVEIALPSLDPNPTYVLVHRPDDWVRRRDLDPAPYRLLCELVDGRRLGDALDAASKAPEVDPATLEGGIASWFQDWMKWGLFRSISVDGSR